MKPGMMLGHYEITAPLGVGGMGEVYRARDTQLKREVALKVLPAEVSADPDRLARFRREAELLAALNHPHVAQIHGLVHDAGTPAIVMELVEGQTLADRIGGAPCRSTRRCPSRSSWPTPSSTRTSTASSTATSNPRTSS